MRLIAYLWLSLRLRYVQEVIERIERARLTYCDDYREAVRERAVLQRRLRGW